MSVVLWPRQEVLQLVIPHLGNVGKGLNQFNAFHAVNKLSKLQNQDHMISYDNWYSVAKGSLKWNDHCASLFWEMLATAKTYLHPNMVPAQREDMLVDIECVVIFLAMHIIETTAAKPTAPTIAYEAVWPLDEKGEVYPSSPVASPSSPAKEVRSRALSPMSSPMSPRSPRNSPQKPQSPRTLTTSATRTPRASTQHLHSVRQKIPIILRALNSSDIENIGGIDLDEGKLDFQVSRRVADALGMVLCGGQSRDQTVSPLSSLHPAWSGENESSLQSILAQDFVAWINLHLSMNDLLYPALQTPSMLEGVDEGMKATHHPQRVSTPLGSLSRFSPTVISTVTATTIIHVVTSGYSRTSSFRSRHADRSSHRPSDASYHDLFDSDAEFNLDIGVSADTFLSTDGDHSNPSASPVRQDLNAGSVSYDDTNESKYDLAADQRFRELLPADHQAPNSKIENALPQLFLSYCSRSKLYMVSPYYSATVTGSADCDIVIGAVYGAVIVNGCERVRITAACRRLVVLNCLECEFQVASLSPTVIIGDCRNLSFGPHNVNYRNLKHHLRLVDLASLMGPSASSTASISSIPNLEATSNQWSSLCDVNTCLDLAGTNASALASGERLASTSTVGQAVYELPSPHAATATLQPVDKFKALVVPVKSEFAQLEATPLTLPREYKQQLLLQKQAVDETRSTLLSLIRSAQIDKEGLLAGEESSSKSSMSAESGVETMGRDELDAKLLSSSLLARKFVEWMVSTDNIQEVLDLIRLESDKVSGIH